LELHSCPEREEKKLVEHRKKTHALGGVKNQGGENFRG
jgi:hypothetical protein